MAQIQIWLNGPISGKRLSLFRVIFGVFMAYEMLDYLKIKLVETGFLQPGTLFNFSPFQFLDPLPAGVFKGLLMLMLVATIMITIGFQTKKASLFFAVAYMYIILLERAYYNNHIYLFALLAFILSIIDTDQHFSVSKKISGKAISWVPRWHLFLLQWQIVIVYFFGGIAKLSPDWLIEMEPIKSARANIPEGVWYSFIKQDWGLQFFIYGGLVLDLLMSLCLFHKKLKWIAIPGIILFNFMNSKIFNDIGIFPYLMLFALLMFVTTDEIRKVFPSLYVSDPSAWSKQASTPSWLKNIVIVYVIFQMLMPLRGHLFSKNMDWTGIHQSFSWRMKIMTREIKEMQWVVVNGDTNESIPITHGQMINNLQIETIARSGEAVLEFAKYIKSEAIKRKIPNPQVHAKIMISFNGRPAQLYVKPEIDLASPTFNMSNTEKWLMPLKG